MAFLFDNLSALIATFGLVILLSVLQLNRSQADVDHTSHYADAQRTMAFLQVVESDLRSAVSLGTTADVSNAFAFTVRFDPENPADQTVRYRLVASGTNAHVIERWIDGTRVGTSSEVRSWDVQALAASGAPAATPAAAVQVRLRLATLAGDRERLWETTVAPPLLRASTL